MREESRAEVGDVSVAQQSVLQRLHECGPTTAASLAAWEHVSQQAIAQTVAPLKAAGLVTAGTDPTDGRKTLLSLSEATGRLFESARSTRHHWLAEVIESSLTEHEQRTLELAVELLERLAAAGPDLSVSPEAHRQFAAASTGAGTL
jgi:DNA-binding MarR family transcriptional regulator